MMLAGAPESQLKFSDNLQRRVRSWSLAMRILLVEDDCQVAEYIRRQLEEEGSAVTVCHDGTAGLRAAELHAFDIIVLDLMTVGPCLKVKPQFLTNEAIGYLAKDDD